MSRLVYLMAILFVAHCINENLADESLANEAPKKSARVKNPKQKQPKQATKAEAPKQNNYYYFKHDGDLKDLFGPYCIVKNKTNKGYSNHYFAIGNEAENLLNSFWSPPEKIDERRFELVVVPKLVTVSNIRWGSSLLETIDTTVYSDIIKFEYVDLNEPEPKYGFSKVIKHQMELWVKVELSTGFGSKGYSPSQKKVILDSIKNNKPIHIKGVLKLYAFGETPQELKDDLEKRGLSFVVEEINGEPILKQED